VGLRVGPVYKIILRCPKFHFSTLFTEPRVAAASSAKVSRNLPFAFSLTVPSSRKCSPTSSYPSLVYSRSFCQGSVTTCFYSLFSSSESVLRSCSCSTVGCRGFQLALSRHGKLELLYLICLM